MADAGTRELRLPQGTIRYADSGSGEPIVFLHGLLVNGRLWRKVAPRLEREGYRCIVPDWPLGSHELPMERGADLSPPGVARMVADFLAALELDGVTIVGNDTGGAISQIVATEHPERIGRLVLTNCDAYENFLPPLFRYLQVAARVPGALPVLLQSMRLPLMRRTPISFGWLTKRPIEPEVVEGWVRPALSDRRVVRDARKLLRGISKRQTLRAAMRLATFDRPTLIAWAPEDRFFPYEHAERLAATVPDARLEAIEDSYAFVSEDQPERLAELMLAFMRETAAGSRAA